MAKITLFGLAGTGTSSTGKFLAERLGYKFISSGNMFRARAKDLGLSLPEFGSLCENEPEHDKALDQEIKYIGETTDNFVVESRLAWYFIPDSIKIKFTCDFEERSKRLASRDGGTVEEAGEAAKIREQSEVSRYENYYGLKNVGADEDFDLIIDTTSTPTTEIVEQILTYLRTDKGLAV